jgi:hypothetical protein
MCSPTYEVYATQVTGVEPLGSPLKKEGSFMRHHIIRVLAVAAIVVAMVAVGALPAFASDPPPGSTCGAAYGAHVAGVAQTHSGEHNPGMHQGFSGFPLEELDC